MVPKETRRLRDLYSFIYALNSVGVRLHRCQGSSVLLLDKSVGNGRASLDDITAWTGAGCQHPDTVMLRG